MALETPLFSLPRGEGLRELILQCQGRYFKLRDIYTFYQPDKDLAKLQEIWQEASLNAITALLNNAIPLLARGPNEQVSDIVDEMMSAPDCEPYQSRFDKIRAGSYHNITAEEFYNRGYTFYTGTPALPILSSKFNQDYDTIVLAPISISFHVIHIRDSKRLLADIVRDSMVAKSKEVTEMFLTSRYKDYTVGQIRKEFTQHVLQQKQLEQLEAEEEKKRRQNNHQKLVVTPTHKLNTMMPRKSPKKIFIKPVPIRLADPNSLLQRTPNAPIEGFVIFDSKFQDLRDELAVKPLNVFKKPAHATIAAPAPRHQVDTNNRSAQLNPEAKEELQKLGHDWEKERNMVVGGDAEHAEKLIQIGKIKDFEHGSSVLNRSWEFQADRRLNGKFDNEWFRPEAEQNGGFWRNNPGMDDYHRSLAHQARTGEQRPFDLPIPALYPEPPVEPVFWSFVPSQPKGKKSLRALLLSGKTGELKRVLNTEIVREGKAPEEVQEYEDILRDMHMEAEENIGIGREWMKSCA